MLNCHKNSCRFQKNLKAIYYSVALFALMSAPFSSKAMEEQKNQEESKDQREKARIKCVWRMEKRNYRTAALEILEKRALTIENDITAENYKARVTFLKKLGEFLRENSFSLLNLNVLKDLKEGNIPLSLQEFYQKTKQMITEDGQLSPEEKYFIHNKVDTFYNLLLERSIKISPPDWKSKLERSFFQLRASLDVPPLLRHKIHVFENFYLKTEPNIDELQEIAEVANISLNSSGFDEKTKMVLKKVASKIYCKLGHDFLPKGDTQKILSHKQSFLERGYKLSHPLCTYYLAQLYGNENPQEQYKKYQDPKKALNLYIGLAAAGFPNAAYDLALIFENGKLTISVPPEDDNDARHWHKKSIQDYYARALAKGHPIAQYEQVKTLQWRRHTGDDVIWLRLLKESAESGYSKAQMELAQLYEKENPFGAFELYLKAAHQEEADAYYPLGYAYEMGKGTTQNWDEALKYYTLADQVEDSRAFIRLGKIYLKGKGGIPKEEERALAYFEKAFKGDDPQGAYYLGLVNLNKDPAKAFIKFTTAAEHSHSKALFLLGSMYQFGKGTEQSYEEAKKCYEKAGESHGAALDSLAWLYKRGLGIPQDKAQALALWEKAANTGSSEAAFRAGKLLLKTYMDQEKKVVSQKAEGVKHIAALEEKIVAAIAHLQEAQKHQKEEEDRLSREEGARQQAKQERLKAEEAADQQAKEKHRLLIEEAKREKVEADKAVEQLEAEIKAASDRLQEAEKSPKEGETPPEQQPQQSELTKSPKQEDVKILADRLHAAQEQQRIKSERLTREEASPVLTEIEGKSREEAARKEGEEERLAQERANQQKAEAVAAVKRREGEINEANARLQEIRSTQQKEQQLADELIKKSHRYLTQAASLPALYLLGRMHEEGIGCEKNPIEAVKFYTQAAEQGHVLAQFKLGQFYETSKEEGKAFSWYNRASEHHEGARFALGLLYQEGRGTSEDLDKAFACFQNAADKKDLGALKAMKKLTQRGEKNALDWFEKQSDGANAYIKKYWAKVLEEGVLVKQDIGRAIDFYKEAALKGESSAQLRLADLKKVPFFEEYTKGAELHKK